MFLKLGLILVASAAFLFAADNLSYGDWQFTGKDNEGVAWTGTLTIGKLDTERFNAEKYTHMCRVDAKSEKSSRGVDAPCKYDAAARTLKIGGGPIDSYSYSALLASDGKTLSGKWDETTGRSDNGQRIKVKKTGEWSAKLAK